jgi:hypothetical protein
VKSCASSTKASGIAARARPERHARCASAVAPPRRGVVGRQAAAPVKRLDVRRVELHQDLDQVDLARVLPRQFARIEARNESRYFCGVSMIRSGRRSSAASPEELGRAALAELLEASRGNSERGATCGSSGRRRRRSVAARAGPVISGSSSAPTISLHSSEKSGAPARSKMLRRADVVDRFERARRRARARRVGSRTRDRRANSPRAGRRGGVERARRRCHAGVARREQ